MAISKDQVRHVANLARLEIDESEVELYSEQLSRILEAIDELNQVDTEQIEPTAHVLSLHSVMREDTAGECLDREVVLQQAPDRQGPYFRVPKVVAGGDGA